MPGRTRRLRPTPWSRLEAPRAAACALLLAACSQPGKSTTTFVCDPACPSGSHCTDAGCVPDLPPPDLATASGASLDASDGGCSPACGGDTPYCGGGGQCVACLRDEHCPTGQVCQVAGASAACVPGCHDDARCGAGMSCCQGSCLDTRTDVNNCGACGGACASPHAVPACTDGACGLFACQPGWADCDQQPGDGCEVGVAVDPKNCGACGRACAIEHAVPGCAGACYIAACDFGFDDCDGDQGNGCEVAVLSDPKNCGGCSMACARPSHGTAACANAACQVASCDAGYADCDGAFNTGCEASLLTDVKNCGACGAACPQGLVCRNGGCTCPQCNFPNATSKCLNNQCAIDACLAGFADCDGQPGNGCEVDTRSDAKNCGACGNACPNNAPACVDGLCSNEVTVCDTQTEGGTDKIVCPNNTKVLSVDFASYGTPNGQCGAFVIDNNCHAANSQQIVEGFCLGQSSCMVDATNDVFGDPCYGTTKRLYIQVSCG